MIYREWVRPYVGGCYGKQVCVDGKSVRGVNKRGTMNLHMISTWVREDGISLGRVKTGEKSNEITAIPKLLDSVDIQGSIVTIDAMGCQREIAKKIIEREANYLLAVKKNQPTLYEEIAEYFQWAIQDRTEAQRLDRYTEKSFDHGKNVTWKVYSTKDTVWFESKQEWAFLRAFIMIERVHKKQKETTTEQAFYISSLETEAKEYFKYARGHWSVENQLHWMLDVAFREDACLVHQANAPQNLALFRKMALTLIKQDSTYKASVRRKQKMAGWDNDYALSIIS
jgi:predicted transposase YbfD/YdcC